MAAMTVPMTSTPHDMPPAWDPEDQDALKGLIYERLAGDMPDPDSPDGERLADAERTLLKALHTIRRLRALREGGMSEHEAHDALQWLDSGILRRAEQARRILSGRPVSEVPDRGTV